jgi:hypothetical protein
MPQQQLNTSSVSFVPLDSASRIRLLPLAFKKRVPQWRASFGFPDALLDAFALILPRQRMRQSCALESL